MLRLLGIAISIGLADSLNPSTLGPGLYLAADRGAAGKVLAFTGATFAVFLSGGVLLVLGPGNAILALLPHPNATTRYVLEALAGVALLIGVPILWRRRHRPLKPPGEEGRSIAGRSPAILGATISIVELPTAFPYFAVVAAIVGSGVGVGRQLTVLVVYNLCFVAPLLAIVVAVSLAGDAAVERLRRVRAVLRAHWPAIAAGVALVAGVFVTVLGVTGLTGRRSGTVGHVSRQVHKFITR
ncbi:MAG TPA: GAP family protein [Solirubrobacteraceae bacterium]|nr:GAP family protein [Solirubrobacteraceae bacterium]